MFQHRAFPLGAAPSPEWRSEFYKDKNRSAGPTSHIVQALSCPNAIELVVWTHTSILISDQEIKL